VREVYYRELSKLEKYGVDIAFINTVPGISYWTGAIVFIKRVRPKLVVPMHLRGETVVIDYF